MIKLDLLRLERLQYWYSQRESPWTWKITLVTIAAIWQLTEDIKQAIARHPCFAENFEDIVYNVLKPLSRAQISHRGLSKALLSEKQPETTADELCPICKDELRSNQENEGALLSSSKPQIYRCKTSRNSFHVSCLFEWTIHSPRDDDEAVCQLCSDTMNRSDIILLRAVDVFEGIHEFWTNEENSNSMFPARGWLADIMMD